MPEKIKTKAPKPTFNIKNHINSPFIHFYFEFAHLKQLFRQGWLTRNVPPERCESVAEHSFGVAVTALLLAEIHFPELNILKVLRMALIHDLGEVYAGDIIPSHQVPREEKYKLEKESMKRVFCCLPNSDNYLNLWEEFEQGASPEAQFVRQIDKLEMALQASVYQHQQVENLAEFYHSARFAIKLPQLEIILNELEDLK